MALLPRTLIGHEKPYGQLLYDIAKNNVAHAYLFSGPKHIGKFTCARLFAFHLLCEGVAPSDHEQVKAQVERLIHPDLLALDALWIEDVQEKWEDIARLSNVPQQHRSKPPKAKTDTIGIDDIRALQERLYDTGSSRYLCCLMRSVERMPIASANAFLKILEEPPPRVVFVLTTEAESALLPTLVSRTRRLRFQPVAASELAPLLTDLADDERQLVLHLSEGAPGKMKQLLDDPESLRNEKQLHAQAKRFWQSPSLPERFSWLTSFSDKPEETDSLLLHLGLTLQEMPADTRKIRWAKEYARLASRLKSNVHRALSFEHFALAVSG